MMHFEDHCFALDAAEPSRARRSRDAATACLPIFELPAWPRQSGPLFGMIDAASRPECANTAYVFMRDNAA